MDPNGTSDSETKRRDGNTQQQNRTSRMEPQTVRESAGASVVSRPKTRSSSNERRVSGGKHVRSNPNVACPIVQTNEESSNLKLYGSYSSHKELYRRRPHGIPYEDLNPSSPSTGTSSPFGAVNDWFGTCFNCSHSYVPPLTPQKPKMKDMIDDLLDDLLDDVTPPKPRKHKEAQGSPSRPRQQTLAKIPTAWEDENHRRP